MTYTTNYNLDLYEPEDNANLCDGFNHNMQKLDSIIFQLNSMLATAQGSLNQLTTRVTSLEARVSELEKKA